MENTNTLRVFCEMYDARADWLATLESKSTCLLKSVVSILKITHVPEYYPYRKLGSKTR